MFDKPLVTFDIESTGLSVSDDYIVELAACKTVKYRTGSLKRNEEVWLIKPPAPIRPEATAIHGITNEMVKDCPSFEEVAIEIRDFFHGCALNGHNIRNFDIQILQAEMIRTDLDFSLGDYDIIDTYLIETIENPNTLTALYEKYTGKKLEDAHSALNDVKANEELLLAQLDKHNVTVSTWKELEDRYDPDGNKRLQMLTNRKLAIKDGRVTINFGKHCGTFLDDMVKTEEGVDYLLWMVREAISPHADYYILEVLEKSGKLYE